METESKLNFDAFFAKVGAVQIRYFSYQTESDEIYQTFLTSSRIPTTFYLNPNTI